MKPPLSCPALPSPALALHGHFHRSQRGAGGFGLSTFGSWPLVHDFAQSLLGEYSVSSNPPGPQAVSPPASCCALEKARVLQLCCVGCSLARD